MALVNYSDSDSSDGEIEPTIKRIRSPAEKTSNKRLPAPVGIVDLYEDHQHIDDTTHHQGRVRSFAHERGNWASYLSIRVPHHSDWLELGSSIAQVLENSTDIQFNTVEDIHISLTRTIAVRHHWLDELQAALLALASSYPALDCSRLSCGGCRFFIGLCKVVVYCNDEKTRTFVSIRVNYGSDKLTPLVRDLDKKLAMYKLPPFYKEASFHASVCWCLGDAKAQLNDEVIEPIQAMVDDFFTENPPCQMFSVETLRWATGCKQMNFPLASKNTILPR